MDHLLYDKLIKYASATNEQLPTYIHPGTVSLAYLIRMFIFFKYVILVGNAFSLIFFCTSMYL